MSAILETCPTISAEQKELLHDAVGYNMSPHSKGRPRRVITHEVDAEANGGRGRQWLGVTEPTLHPGGGVQRSNTLSPASEPIMRFQVNSEMNIWELPVSSKATMNHREIALSTDCTRIQTVREHPSTVTRLSGRSGPSSGRKSLDGGSTQANGNITGQREDMVVRGGWHTSQPGGSSTL